MNEESAKNLTDTELELMAILWRIGEGNVKAVQNQLPSDRPLAYTSISTILRILVKKGACRIKEQGRKHIYVPAVTEKEYKDQAIANMVNQVFGGDSSGLLMALAENASLTESDRSELLSILEQKKENS